MGNLPMPDRASAFSPDKSEDCAKKDSAEAESFQSVKKVFFDRLAEVKKAPKPSKPKA